MLGVVTKSPAAVLLSRRGASDKQRIEVSDRGSEKRWIWRIKPSAPIEMDLDFQQEGGVFFFFFFSCRDSGLEGLCLIV